MAVKDTNTFTLIERILSGEKKSGSATGLTRRVSKRT